MNNTINLSKHSKFKVNINKDIQILFKRKELIYLKPDNNKFFFKFNVNSDLLYLLDNTKDIKEYIFKEIFTVNEKKFDRIIIDTVNSNSINFYFLLGNIEIFNIQLNTDTNILTTNYINLTLI